MKLLLDANLSFRLLRRLEPVFPGSQQVGRITLPSRTDESVWDYAGFHGFVIVSKDNDFRQLSFLAPRAAREAHPRLAVITVHGMGQQVEFETLDAVAQSLLAEQLRRRERAGAPPSVRQVEVEGKVLRRVEMKLLGTYWAPRTEGRVTLRDVVSFLKDAGFNGIAHSFGAFQRWVFNKRVEFPRSLLSLGALIGALAVVLSLSAASAILTAVGAARASLSGPPRWLTPELFSDLTAVAGIFSLAAVCLGALLGLAMFRRNTAPRLEPWSLPAPSRAAIWLLFLLTCHDSDNPRRVKNVVDQEASIPLVAHTEYWKNRLIWRYLYNSICRRPWNEGEAA